MQIRSNCSSTSKRRHSILNSPYQVKSTFKLFEPVSSAKLFLRHFTSQSLRLSSGKISRLTSEFLKKLEEYEIPESLVQVYADFIHELPSLKFFQFLRQETDSLKNNRSKLQMAISSYNLWINSLENIKNIEKIACSDQRWKVSQVFISRIISSLADHAYLALIMVENIQAWESLLKSIIFPEKETINFIINNRNVLDDLLTSCDFLHSSELSYYFSFSISDPFLLSISKRQLGQLSKNSIFISNFHSARDCKQLFYLKIDKFAYTRMKELSKEFFKRVVISEKLPSKLERKKSLSLPVIKLNKKYDINPLAEQLLNDIILCSLSKDLEKIFNHFLTEKILAQILISEITKKVKFIAVKYYKKEVKKYEEFERIRKENIVIKDTILLELLDTFYFEDFKAQIVFSEIFEEALEILKAETELRVRSENIIIFQEIIENIFGNFICNEALPNVIDLGIEEIIQENRIIELEKLRIIELNLVISSLISEEYIETIASMEYLQDIAENVYLESKKECEIEMKLEESSKNARNLQMFTIYENIIRNLIENLIEPSSLHLLCQETLQEELKSQNLETQTQVLFKIQTENLQLSIYSEILDQFVQSKWLIELSKNMLKYEEAKTSIYTNSIHNEDSKKQVEQAEEFVMEVFTPEIHSPNEVSIFYTQEELINESQSINDAVPKLAFNFAQDLKTIKSPNLQAFFEKPKNLQGILGKYKEIIQKEYEEYLSFGDELIEEYEKYWNTRFFWIVQDYQIIGMMVYSNDCDEVIVNHISVLNFELLPDACRFVLGYVVSNCCNVVVKFKKEPQIEVVEALKQIGFLPCKLNNEFVRCLVKSLDESKQTPYNCQDFQSITTPDLKTPKNFSIKILTSQTLSTTTSETLPISFESSLPDTGTRIHLLQILSNILSQSPSNAIQDSPANKLQIDLAEILELSTFSPFPSIPEQILILSKETKISSINLHLNINCSNIIIEEYENKTQKFIYIPKHKVKVRNGEGDCKMFIVDTADSNFALFFYHSSELQPDLIENKRISHIDLFYYVNELYKCLDETESLGKDLWVPCFRIQKNWDLDWIRGFSIIDQENESVFVAECKEEVLLEFGVGECNKSLKFTEKKVRIIEDFIFGVLQKDLLETLEIPLLASIVRKQDWVS